MDGLTGIIIEFVATFLHFFKSTLNEKHFHELNLSEITAIKDFGNEIRLPLLPRRVFASIERVIRERMAREQRAHLTRVEDTDYMEIEKLIDVPL